MSDLKSIGWSLPKDCAIVGYDDVDSWDDYVDPPLTSVRHEVRDTGRKAAEALIGIIEGSPTQSVRLPVTLVIRESCGCKPNS